MLEDDDRRYRTVTVQIGRYPSSLWWVVLVDKWSWDGGRNRAVLARGRTEVHDLPADGLTVREAVEIVLRDMVG